MSTFTLRSASIILAGDIFDYAGFMIYVDPALNNQELPAVVDAYGTFTAIPDVTLKMGQFLVPYSREANTSSSKLLFVERSSVTRFIPSYMGRDIGIMADYRHDFGDGPQWIGAALAGVNGTGPWDTDNNTAKDVALRVGGNPFPWEYTRSLFAEGYYYIGKPEITGLSGVDETRLGVAAGIDRDDFNAQIEYLGRSISPDEGADLEEGGYYLQGGYKFNLPWDWWQQVEPALRYEAYDPNKDLDGDAYTAITLGCNLHFDTAHHCKLMLNYGKVDEEEGSVDNDCVSAQFQVRF